jgi:hypothetical protein
MQQAQGLAKTRQYYNDVFRVSEMAHKIRGKCLIGNIEKLPRTVDEAVERLIREYSLEDKTNIANMTENELMTLSLLFNRYSLWVYVYSICNF